MEMYLLISNHRIEDICFYTDGCEATLACGSYTTELAKGLDIYASLDVSPKQIIDSLKELPEDHHLCAILSVSTLHKAIADYLLKD